MKRTPFPTDVSADELCQIGITASGYIETAEIIFPMKFGIFAKAISAGIMERPGHVRRQWAHWKHVAQNA